MSLLLINKMTVKPGKRDEVIDILLESGKAFDNNPACQLYLVSRDKKDDNVIWVQDIWTDAEAHKQAMNNDKMQEFVQKSIPLLEGMPEMIEVDAAGGKHSFELN